MIEIKINFNDQNKRLDNFIKKYLYNAPISFIYKLFRKKDIKVNKKPAKPEYITKEGDLIQVYITDQALNDFKDKKEIQVSNKKTFEVIYEDENILIVNKPYGLLVYDGDNKTNNDDTLTKQVLNYLIQNGSYNPEKENTFIPSLAHRIDRNTTGLVVFGKNILALQELFEAFKDHGNIYKEYTTLVSGKLVNKGEIEAPLIKDEIKKIVNVDFKNGLYAKSIYEPIKSNDDMTLLKVIILTGRTHQIRVHLKHINHPIVNDGKYGNQESDRLAKKYKLHKYFLHARCIRFTNLKGTLEYLNNKDFIAPYFKDEKELIERI